MIVGVQTNSSKVRQKPPISSREKIAHMEISKLQHIHDAYARETVSLVRQLENEAQSHRKWLYDAKESLKRKIFESAGLKYVDHSPKRLRTAYVYENDENLNPNTINFDPSKENEQKCIEASPNVDINSMTVKELRKELKSLHLDTKGLKKDLQKRLGEAVRNENQISSSKEDKGNHTTLNSENEVDSPNMNKSLSSEIEGEHQKIDNDGTEEDNKVVVMMATKEEDSMMEDNKIICENDGNEGITCEHITMTDANSQNNSSNDVDMGRPPIEADPTPSLVTDCETASLHHKGESKDLNLTSEKVEKSIDGMKKLSVDSSTKEGNVPNVDLNVIDSTKQVVSKNKKTPDKKKSKYSGYRSASPKPGRVHKFMKATSKLFSPSKKRDVTPSKPPTPSMKSKSTVKPTKKTEEEVLVSEVIESSSPKVKSLNKGVSVGEIVKKIEIGTVQQAKSETEITKPQSQIASTKNNSNVSDITTEGETQSQQSDASMSPNLEAEDNKKSSTKKPVLKGKSSVISNTSSVDSGKSISSTSKTSQRLQQKKEQIAAARKARLEEMRDKSKALAKAKEISLSAHKTAQLKKSAQKSVMPIHKSKFKNSEDKMIKTQIKEKMRQKAAAEALKKANATSSSVAPFSASKLKKKSSNDATRPTPQRKATPSKPKILSPMDTYEISDREDSDSEYSSEEDKSPSPKKRVPKWARSANLNPALQRQFLAPDRLDPEHLFHDINTCNLEDIFNQKRDRYTKRTSSGNWTKDKVTAMEKLVYRRQMGFGEKKSKLNR